MRTGRIWRRRWRIRRPLRGQQNLHYQALRWRPPEPRTKIAFVSLIRSEPLWARDGRQLFDRWQDQMWAVDVRANGGFATSKPRLLFENRGLGTATPSCGYDISLDSQRFLMVKIDQSKPTPVIEMIFVQNWSEELERLVPTK